MEEEGREEDVNMKVVEMLLSVFCGSAANLKARFPRTTSTDAAQAALRVRYRFLCSPVSRTIRPNGSIPAKPFPKLREKLVYFTHDVLRMKNPPERRTPGSADPPAVGPPGRPKTRRTKTWSTQTAATSHVAPHAWGSRLQLQTVLSSFAMIGFVPSSS